MCQTPFPVLPETLEITDDLAAWLAWLDRVTVLSRARTNAADLAAVVRHAPAALADWAAQYERAYREFVRDNMQCLRLVIGKHRISIDTSLLGDGEAYEANCARVLVAVRRIFRA